MNNNTTLHNAKRNKKDEFYTRYEDISAEIAYYKEFLKGKKVYCNCDDPEVSNFWRYFHEHFSDLGLKKLVSTHIEFDEPHSYAKVYEGGNDSDITIGNVINLKGPGDFQSDECVEFLKDSDIVITNPPFSLFSSFVNQIIDYNKRFIIIGSHNAITYKDVFPLIKNNQMWLGETFRNLVGFFISNYEDYATSNCHEDGCIRVSGVVWFTNVENNRRNEKFFGSLNNHPMYYKCQSDYPMYENCSIAINCDKTNDIPCDYDGIIGVPVSFINKYNPDEFEILGLDKDFTDDCKRGLIDGKRKYARIFIRTKGR